MRGTYGRPRQGPLHARFLQRGLNAAREMGAIDATGGGGDRFAGLDKVRELDDTLQRRDRDLRQKPSEAVKRNGLSKEYQRTGLVTPPALSSSVACSFVAKSLRKMMVSGTSMPLLALGRSSDCSRTRSIRLFWSEVVMT